MSSSDHPNLAAPLDFSDRSLWADGYQLGCGTPVRILADDLGGDKPLGIAVYQSNGWWALYSYTADGRFATNSSPGSNLIRKPVTRKGWVNVESHHWKGCAFQCNFLYPTKEVADNCRTAKRIACIEIEFEEGQGLE